MGVEFWHSLDGLWGGHTECVGEDADWRRCLGDFDRVVYVRDHTPAGWVGKDCGAREAERGREVEGCGLDLGGWWSVTMSDGVAAGLDVRTH